MKAGRLVNRLAPGQVELAVQQVAADQLAPAQVELAVQQVASDRLAPGQVELAVRQVAAPRRRTRTIAVVALFGALVLAGCGGRKATAPPPTAEVPPAPTPPAEPATPPTAEPQPTPPPTAGQVTAPWDTAARSRETRRNHVYPKGESELGRKMVAALPDPGGMRPQEGGPPPAPAPRPDAAPGDCWQAQLLATGDAARANRVRSEAEALLGVGVEIVNRDGTYRVRAGGPCLDPDAAMRLVQRARGEGWPEAFRVRAGS
jgi:hypothetical protein